MVEADGYARELIQYIHLNPVRAENKRRPVPVQLREELSRYRRSGHRVYAGRQDAKEPALLCHSFVAVRESGSLGRLSKRTSISERPRRSCSLPAWVAYADCIPKDAVTCVGEINRRTKRVVANPLR